ncbi:MAG: MarR family transcriptional regulator [Streptosporangiales bacterium]|nr:MarR family transcriptional regulator [Streptosporangiales bacterium]
MMAQLSPMVSAAVEDYAKTIYALEATSAEPVSTTALAQRLHVTSGAVSTMLKRLAGLGLITHRPYHGIRLTPEGRRVALKVIRRHRLLELFLVEVLELSWDQVHAEAEVLEHALSEELEQIIAAKLGNPIRDPHGDPIPSSELELQEPRTDGLDALAVGTRGRFVRVSDRNPEMLRYLTERGIRIGDDLEVVDRQPFGGPLLVRFGGRVEPIGGELARAMRVEVLDRKLADA